MLRRKQNNSWWKTEIEVVIGKLISGITRKTASMITK